MVSPIVDVGGGIGSLELALLERPGNATLNFKIFDLPSTIENAQKVSLHLKDTSNLNQEKIVSDLG